jgi:hypothetical protein
MIFLSLFGKTKEDFRDVDRSYSGTALGQQPRVVTFSATDVETIKSPHAG